MRAVFFYVIEFISFESACRGMEKYLDVKNRKRRIVRIVNRMNRNRLNGNRMSKNRPDCETFGLRIVWTWIV